MISGRGNGSPAGYPLASSESGSNPLPSKSNNKVIMMGLRTIYDSDKVSRLADKKQKDPLDLIEISDRQDEASEVYEELKGLLIEHGKLEWLIILKCFAKGVGVKEYSLLYQVPYRTAQYRFKRVKDFIKAHYKLP